MSFPIPFSLATVSSTTGHSAAIVIEGKLYPLDSFEGQFEGIGYGKIVLDYLESWGLSLTSLISLTASMISGKNLAAPITNYSFTTLLRFPNKLLAVGANYGGHLKEMGLPAEKWEPMPYFFRPPTTSLVGPGRTVRKPRSSQQFDWELELVLVLGKSLRHANSIHEASEAIAGYTIGLDLSCRDLQTVKGVGMDIGRGKAQDTLAPCGPLFVPKHNLPNGVGELGLKLWVNNEQMVNGNTNDMLFSPEEIFVELSKYMTLEAGDLIFTGAPAGGAKAHGDRWLQAGDWIKAEIEGLGVLEIGIVVDD